MGSVRVPLYTMEDGFRGLPNFMCNRFAGNARDELVLGIKRGHILSEEAIETALKSSLKTKQ